MHELKEGRHNHFIHLLCICVLLLVSCARILFRRARIVVPVFRWRPSSSRLILGLNFCASRCTVGEFADFVARFQRCVFIWLN